MLGRRTWGHRVRHISCLTRGWGLSGKGWGQGGLKASEEARAAVVWLQSTEVCCHQDASFGWQKGWQTQLGWEA